LSIGSIHETGKVMGQNEKVTVSNLADLAKLAGVSPSTVSRSLSGNLAISEATRTRISALAREHGFQPNQLARNLRLKRSQAIGVIMPLGHETGQHMSDPFFITMLGHLADALTERGYDMLLSRIIPTDDRWLDRLVDSGRVDGVILIGQSDQIANIERVAERYLPLVVWGANLPGQHHCTIGSDNYAGGLMATRHLIAQGRKSLAFLGNPEIPELGQRHQGFLDAHREANLAAPPQTVPVPLTAEGTYAMICDYLGRHPAPDGVFAASDIIAMSAIRALAERRMRVPEDVSVIGYDDVSIAAHMSPPLTTIRQDLARGATLLVESLFHRVAGEKTQSSIMPPQLIVRDSSWLTDD
jgi:DNA-binding LacI/PurR family transcriptional regulator